MATSKLKLIILSALTIVAALFCGYATANFVGRPLIGPAINLLIALLVFLTLAALQSLLTRSVYLIWALTILVTLALAIPFYKDLSSSFGGAVLISLILVASGLLSAKKDLVNSLKIDFFRTTSHVAGKLSVVVVLLGTVVFTNNLAFPDITQSVVKSTDPIVKQLTGGFLPAAIADSLTQQAQKLILDQLNQLPSTIKQAVIIGFGIVLFFSIKGLMFIVNWLTALMGLALYKTLLAVGFIKIKTEAVDKEVISLE